MEEIMFVLVTRALKMCFQYSVSFEDFYPLSFSILSVTSFGINDSSTFSIKNWIPLKPVLGAVRDVAPFIISHEQTKKSRVCNFRFFILVCLLTMDQIITRSFRLYFYILQINTYSPVYMKKLETIHLVLQ